MKKVADAKYPHSASLFQFCRKVLDHKFGGIRVIDQDVGQILGFDPADCSHWKKGKKNIRSIAAIKSIANHLGVDEKLVIDVASGELDDNEAFFEYCGYGASEVESTVVDNVKKEFYRRNASQWTKDKEAEFQAFFDVKEPQINIIVKEIHQKINFQEAPLYLPEIVAAYPKLHLSADASMTFTGESKTDILKVTNTNDEMTITYPAGSEMRPYMRYRIARAFATYFLKDMIAEQKRSDLSEYADHVVSVQSNLFAAKLLTPANLVREEMKRLNVAKDIISQMSEVFWVSKLFMNARLKSILERQPEV